ncbi:MAG: UDP-3-O-(3-hydroxymyristoyl)glucosamine N-acyltransferase [bacterium]
MTSRCSHKTEYSLQDLAGRIGGVVLGNASIKIHGIAGLQDAGEGQITFLANTRYRSLVSKTRASALIASQEEPLFKGPVLQVSDPYLAFAMLLEIFYPPCEPLPGIDPSAIVHPETQIGEGVSIQPCAVIKKGVSLGSGAVIGSCAVVCEDSQIGDYSHIHPNVTIYPGTRIGQRVIIHAGSVIGSDGFGYARKDGLPFKIPQIGNVVIEDDCEIGANVTIDRATLGETHIGRGVKIDNLVQIGHNVVIGAHSIVVSQVGISGSTHVGSGVILAGQVGVAGHIQIGDRVTAAARTGITKDIPSGETIGGFMGMPIREWKKSEALYRRFPKLQNKYRDLLKRIEALESKLQSKD